MIEQVGALISSAADALGISRRRLVVNGLMVLVGAGALYLLSPEIIATASVTPVILDLGWWRLALVVVGALLSLGMLGVVLYAVLRRVRWLDALLVELAANAATLVMPAGPAVGGVMQVRLLRRSGATMPEAAGALAAFSFISVSTVLGLAPVAAVLALAQSDPPSSLRTLAFAGGALAVAVLALGVVLLAQEWPFRVIVWLLDRLDSLVLRRIGHAVDASTKELVRRRDELRRLLGRRWPLAAGASGAKWILDFGVLLVALDAARADLGLGLSLLAFVVAAVLRFVPITPGGLGFVEGGLTGVLTAAGVNGITAIVATLVYRAGTFWVPIPVGGLAYVLHRRRHPPKS